MKTDLDALLQAQNIDALLVLGPGQHNPAMVYLTGGGHLTGADLIKRRGETPVLFHGMMERDEAARTGLPCHSYTEYPWNDLMRGADNNVAEALALRRLVNQPLEDRQVRLAPDVHPHPFPHRNAHLAPPGLLHGTHAESPRR